MTITYAATLGKHNITLPDDLLAGVEVPVLTCGQVQGDVGIFPRAPIGRAELNSAVPVPAAGIAVVRGESVTGRNSHILDAYLGDVFWLPVDGASDTSSVALGVLHVPAGSVAMLTHTDEHTSNGVGPGTYVVTGQREQADIIQRVAD